MPKNCKNCGAEMPEEAHICLSCLTETEEKNVIPINDKVSFFANKKRAIALISTALLIIALILICIFYFGNKKPNSVNDEENKTAISTVTQDDGSVVTEYDDGSVETIEPDGTTVVEEKDGTVITKQTDGTVITETPDKTVITEQPDGTVETKKPDGTTITEKPDGTVETKKPNGETEIKKTDGTTTTEKPTEPSTKKPTEPSTKEPNTEKPTESTTKPDSQEIKYEDFTFKYEDFTYNGVKSQKLLITKYTGNDEIVNVPATYNGDNVDEIKISTFFNNNKIKKVIFNATADHVPCIRRQCIMNCRNLEEVVFNWSNGRTYLNDAYSIYGLFSTVYDKFKSVKISGCDYYKVYENGFYYNDSPSAKPNSYKLVQAWGSEWHQPSWCIDAVDVVFDANTTVKEVYLHTSYSSVLRSFTGPYLTYVHINDDNKRYFDDNGIVYDKIDKKCVYYPPAKLDESYKFLDGYSFSNIGNSYTINQKVKTFYIPKNFTFTGADAEKYFTMGNNLRTIYIEDGNPYIGYIKENFTKGEVIIY